MTCSIMTREDCGYQALAYAIMERALKDRSKAALKKDVEDFFKSEWFAVMGAALTKQEPETIRELARGREMPVGVQNGLEPPAGRIRDGRSVLIKIH